MLQLLEELYHHHPLSQGMNIFEGETLKRSCIFSQVETVILKILHSNVFISLKLFFFPFFKEIICNSWNYKYFNTRITTIVRYIRRATNRFLRGIEGGWKLLFYVLPCKIEQARSMELYLYRLRESKTCAMFCQTENTSGIVIRI